MLWNDLLMNVVGVCSQCISVYRVAHAFGILNSLLLLLFLFIVLSFLQTHEIFTINLVQLINDIVNDLCNSRNKDELERVHTSVCHLESIIQSHELCLQSRNRDQDFEEICELFASIIDRLTTHAQTEQVIITSLIDIFKFKDREMDTGNVIISRGHANRCANGHVINDSATEVTSGKVSLCHTHTRFSIINAHTHLRLDNFLQNSSEGLLQSI